MIKKKICMLGAFAVGKTSLVRRFVHSIFSEKYLTSVGVKVDKKTVDAGGGQVDLLLWDIHGEDEFQKVQTSYLRGASGYFLVVDLTRRDSLDTAMVLEKRARDALGDVPFMVLFNKKDLASEREIKARDIERLAAGGAMVLETSALTGEGVEAAFLALAEKMLEKE